LRRQITKGKKKTEAENKERKKEMIFNAEKSGKTSQRKRKKMRWKRCIKIKKEESTRGSRIKTANKQAQDFGYQTTHKSAKKSHKDRKAFKEASLKHQGFRRELSQAGVEKQSV
jgi:hypothetical protein